MKPVFQTRHTRADCGNCFQACLASILETPIAAIPDYDDLAAMAGDWWPPYWRRLQDWLKTIGLELTEYEISDLPKGFDWRHVITGDRYWIASTQVHPEFRHCTVWWGDELAHQPARGFPLDRSTLGPVASIGILVVRDPALLVRELPKLQLEAAAA